MILHKVSRFFNCIFLLSSKRLRPESVKAAIFTLPKN